MSKRFLLAAAAVCLCLPSGAFAQATAAPASPGATGAFAQATAAPASPGATPTPKLIPRAPGDVVPPEHPATPDQIREYLSLTKAADNAHRAFGQLVTGSKAQAPPSFPADFWQDLTNSFNSIDVVAELTPVYQKYFSQEDMAATLAFYRTPAGKRVLTDQPLAAVAAGDVLRHEGQRVGQETYGRHKAEIEASQRPAPPALTSPPSAPAKPSLSSPSETPSGSQPQPQPQP